MNCRGFTVRYQWIAEMCQFRRTEADIVGILIGFTERQFEASKKAKKDTEEGEWIDLSMAFLSAMASESVRSVQYAMRWLEAHGVVEVDARTGATGVTRKRAYKLNLELLDRVAEARDRLGVAVSLEASSHGVSIVPATGVQKLHPTVQKLHPPHAKIAP